MFFKSHLPSVFCLSGSIRDAFRSNKQKMCLQFSPIQRFRKRRTKKASSLYPMMIVIVYAIQLLVPSAPMLKYSSTPNPRIFPTALRSKSRRYSSQQHVLRSGYLCALLYYSPLGYMHW